MIFDSEGFPKDNGATDFMDSARLAGLMAVFDFSRHIITTHQLRRYLIDISPGRSVAVRCPNEEPSDNPNNFTRDQLLCLTAGLHYTGSTYQAAKLLWAAEDRGNRAQNTEYDMPGTTKKFPNGADWLSPSHMDHLRLCAGHNSTWLGRLWLKADIIYQGKFAAMKEPNQLICMVMVSGLDSIRYYKKHNPKWREAIREYWCGWRGEPELAEAMIDKLEYLTGG